MGAGSGCYRFVFPNFVRFVLLNEFYRISLFSRHHTVFLSFSREERSAKYIINMNQLLEDQEERPLWADVAHSSTDEINGDSDTKSWGVRECLIVAVFFVMFFVIFRKKERDPDEEDESSRQPAETLVSTTVDKKVLEEEKREMILNLFQSQKNQQVRVGGLIGSF